MAGRGTSRRVHTRCPFCLDVTEYPANHLNNNKNGCKGPLEACLEVCPGWTREDVMGMMRDKAYGFTINQTIHPKVVEEILEKHIDNKPNEARECMYQLCKRIGVEICDVVDYIPLDSSDSEDDHSDSGSKADKEKQADMSTSLLSSDKNVNKPPSSDKDQATGSESDHDMSLNKSTSLLSSDKNVYSPRKRSAQKTALLSDKDQATGSESEHDTSLNKSTSLLSSDQNIYSPRKRSAQRKALLSDKYEATGRKSEADMSLNKSTPLLGPDHRDMSGTDVWLSKDGIRSPGQSSATRPINSRVDNSLDNLEASFLSEKDKSSLTEVSSMFNLSSTSTATHVSETFVDESTCEDETPVTVTGDLLSKMKVVSPREKTPVRSVRVSLTRQPEIEKVRLIMPKLCHIKYKQHRI